MASLMYNMLTNNGAINRPLYGQSSYTECFEDMHPCVFCGCSFDENGDCCCGGVNVKPDYCYCDVCYRGMRCNGSCIWCDDDGSDVVGDYDYYYSSSEYIPSYDYYNPYGYWGFGWDGFEWYTPVNSIWTTPDSDGGGTTPTTETYTNTFVNTVSDLVGMPYVYGSNGPNSFDCSSTICYGLRQINTQFGDYSANQLYNLFTVPTTSHERGTLVFYDYTSDGIIDHVTTLLGDGNMIHPSSGSGSILNVPSSYLDNYTDSRGGTIYYQEINWNSINS